jgi:DNA-binding response OmpR family regulator
MKGKVAIVEDDNLLALVMSKHLSMEGYQINTFSRGEDLLLSIEDGMIPNIAILDVKLKGTMSGIELCQLLPVGLPVIFCTGNSDHAYLRENQSSKVKGVLIKPIELKELSALISKIL